MQFTDSHCHLDDEAFTEKLPHLLTQCANLSIKRIVVPAISPANFDNVLTLAKLYNLNPIKIHPCLGIHPWFLNGLNESDLEHLSTKIQKERSNIIAIGETGIDGTNIKRSEEPKKELAKQHHFFDFQLNLAKQHNLPVIIHHRQSHQYIVPLLKQYNLTRSGIIHGFSGSYQQAKDYVDLGFKLGIGSTITYSRAKKTINTIKRLPLDALILETDAPSMPISKEVLTDEELSSYNLHNQPNNSPVNLIKIFDVLASIRTENAEELSVQLEKNIEMLFFKS